MKTAWVLAGGGALGAVQVGMIRALVEAEIKPHKMYGTSAGALNAFGFSHLGIEGLEKLWSTIRKKSDIFNDNFGPLLIKKGLHQAKPLEKKLRRVQSEGTPAIPFEVCSHNLTTDQKFYTSHNDRAILTMTVASASIPGVVSPVVREWINADGSREKHYFVDGGTVENVPLKRAIEQGADRIYVLLCGPITTGKTDKWKAGNILSVLFRSLGAMRSEMFRDDIMNCLDVNQQILAGKPGAERIIQVVMIAPTESLGDSMDFAQDVAQARMLYGYQRAQEVLAMRPMVTPEDGKEQGIVIERTARSVG